MIGNQVEGYTIIESIEIGSAKFVVGENPNNPITPYVTWQANTKNDPNNYFWGHYCTDKLGAMADFGKRVSDEADRQRNMKKQRPAPQPEKGDAR